MVRRDVAGLPLGFILAAGNRLENNRWTIVSTKIAGICDMKNTEMHIVSCSIEIRPEETVDMLTIWPAVEMKKPAKRYTRYAKVV
jgi:hypothetical protein